MGDSKQTTEQKQTMDPEYAARLNENYDYAKNYTRSPFKAFSGVRVAGFDPASTQAQDRLLNIADTRPGSATFGQAKDIFSNLGAYRPQTITPQSFTPRTLKGADLSAYTNPYDSQVIDAFIADNERARQIQSVNDAQKATAANAFGGSRHGVADSLTSEAFGRTAANTIAGLRQGGYDRAMTAAGSDIDRLNQGDVFNISNDYEAQTRNASNDMAGAEFRANIGGILKSMSDAELAQELQYAGIMDTVGMSRQAMEQAALDASYEEFMREQNDPIVKQQLANASISTYPSLINTTNTTTKSGGIGGILSPILGVAGAASGLGWKPFG